MVCQAVGTNFSLSGLELLNFINARLEAFLQRDWQTRFALDNHVAICCRRRRGWRQRRGRGICAADSARRLAAADAARRGRGIRGKRALRSGGIRRKRALRSGGIRHRKRALRSGGIDGSRACGGVERQRAALGLRIDREISCCAGSCKE